MFAVNLATPALGGQGEYAGSCCRISA